MLRYPVIWNFCWINYFSVIDDTDEEDDNEDEEEDSDEDEDDSDEDLDMSGSFVQEPKPKRQKIETPEKTPPPSSKKKDKQKPEAKKPGSKKSEAKKPEAKKAVKKEEPTPIKVCMKILIAYSGGFQCNGVKV